ncbi:serine/threonine-protein phosphatase 4 regulatory subunit 2 isoform X1 [Coffea eugenioides]|uniref:Uncharacterized protein isoform X1 n=1 Tax=Coffea arabica TaxID=13443 RepID=A0A6P6W4I7_COFAR|nr:serine/threonine-protein phosphatase 4 regulatory subunit 2-like isoform X1 [Coffea arabica]XP_027161384.1 serine/threonine-protein phosphatase 4 regulatory subunit 2 isoform X1 [Coffea eugenioides]
MAEATAEASETSQNSNLAVDQNHDTSVSHLPNHGIKPQHEFSEEQVRHILEVIAATGKFWHEWDKLKGMLSFYLKQVLSQYPEAKLSSEQQISSMGETFLELVKRLDDALQSFVEGPPFTLQRVCEILLAARTIYPNLSKLALALEKNLLVTSVLTISTDLCPGTSDPRLTTGGRENEEPNAKLESTQNGVQPLGGDKDEIMTEVQASEADEDMTIDMETFEEIVRSSETNSTPTCDSESTSI